jgi:hypothetical protein
MSGTIECRTGSRLRSRGCQDVRAPINRGRPAAWATKILATHRRTILAFNPASFSCTIPYDGEQDTEGKMTRRMSFMHVAMATSVLMISDAGAARAATKFCDIYPERCQYSGDAVYYYYPLGYRMPGSTAPRSAFVRKKPVTTARKTANMISYKTMTIPAHEKTLGNDIQSSRPGSD